MSQAAPRCTGRMVYALAKSANEQTGKSNTAPVGPDQEMQHVVANTKLRRLCRPALLRKGFVAAQRMNCCMH